MIESVCKGCRFHMQDPLKSGGLMDVCVTVAKGHRLPLTLIETALTSSDFVKDNRRAVSKRCPRYQKIKKLLKFK